MIILYIHADVLDDFVQDVKDIYMKDAIKDYNISTRPKRNHVGIGIDYDDYVQVKNKTLIKI